MSPGSSGTRRPHIVLIITDQQRYDTIAALGYPYMITPKLDRMVREGTALRNCFTTAPSCVPARCSLFTGHYPHTTGVYKNGDTWTETWISSLAGSGYRCVNVGKMHTVPFNAQAGFHERYVVENKDRFLEGRYYFDEWDKALRARGIVKQQRELYRRRPDYRERMGAFPWELDEDMHSDRFVGDFACWWLDSYPVDGPVFMEIGFPGPHPPYDPVPRWIERYRDAEVPVPELTESDLAGQPPAMAALRRHMYEVDHDSVVHPEHPDAAQLRDQRIHYYANVSMIDEMVGRLFEMLEKRSMLDDTVIIFASDHGDCLGDHGHIQKWSMYEEVVHVPALLWSGKNFRGSMAMAGSPVDALCSLMDIGPTILELAGLDPEPDMEAVSLMPLLRGGAQKKPRECGQPGLDSAPVAVSDSVWEVAAGAPAFVSGEGRELVFAEHGRDNILDSVEVMTMIRSSRYKMVHFGDGAAGQLFDLDSDPKEQENRWSDPAMLGVRRRMTDALLEWHRSSAYRTRNRRRK